ncbi:VOC family protein, partial [Microbacteriaceae bacterium K1510]|nr:VOC family protein [Microbacteriaceae bacterium K1510]
IVNELPEGEGLATVALRTNQIDQWAERLRAKGLRVTGPLPGSRTRADGSVITWNTLFAEMEGNSLLFPFFIEWGQNDEQRRNDLTTSGVIAPHPVGGVGIKHVAYAVRQAKETVALLGDLLGGQAGEPFEDTRLNATCQALSFQGGDLLFCSPNGPGLVADALATRGERPFLVQFAGDACRGEAHQVLGSVYRF